jgi:hypothetical protein
MIKTNRKNIFIRRNEGQTILTKNDIVKGLSSKKIEEKEQTMNELIKNIINDPYFDQMLMLGMFNTPLTISH